MVKHEFSFGIIPLRKEGKKWGVFLIQHQGGKHWAFPKGHQSPNETPQATAIRELKEETGLDIDTFLPTPPLEEHYFFTSRHTRVEKKVLYFAALVKGEVFLQEEEVGEGKWVLLEDAEAHITFSEGKRMCRELLQIIALIS